MVSNWYCILQAAPYHPFRTFELEICSVYILAIRECSLRVLSQSFITFACFCCSQSPRHVHALTLHTCKQNIHSKPCEVNVTALASLSNKEEAFELQSGLETAAVAAEAGSAGQRCRRKAA